MARATGTGRALGPLTPVAQRYAKRTASDLPCCVVTVIGTVEGPDPRLGTVAVHEVCDEQLVGAAWGPK